MCVFSSISANPLRNVLDFLDFDIITSTDET